MARSRADAVSVVETAGMRALLFRSRRRTLSIQIEPERGLVLRVPYGVSIDFIRDFVERRRDWVLRQSNRLERLASVDPQPRWVDGERISYLGSSFELKLESGSPAGARLEWGAVVVRHPGPIDAQQVKAAVARLYAREAAKLFPALLDECLALPAAAGIARPELKLRAMKSRWGSCDPARAIVTLNTNLMRRDPDLIRYVIMHELAHLRCRRHDQCFYDLLAILCPEWKRLRASLARVRP